MNESAEAAGITTKPQLDNYYRWVEPDTNVTVFLKLETVDRLQRGVLRGICSATDLGDEVGGILLGTTEVDEGSTQTFVDDFEPVACERRNSPFYDLTGKDAGNFEAAVARLRARRTPQVVGYYRSHNRDGLFLSAADLRLIDRNFPGPDSLFLLIKTLANRTCTAGFFFWKDGHIQSEFTDSEAPLIPVSLSSAGQSPSFSEADDEIPIAPTAPVLPVIQDRPETTSPEPGRNRDPRRRLIPALSVAGVAVAITLAVVRYREMGPAQHQAPSVPQPVPVAAANSALAAPSSVMPAPVVRQSAPIIPDLPHAVLPRAGNEPAPEWRDEPKLPTPAPTPEMPAAGSVASEPNTPPPSKPVTAATELPVNTTPPTPAETTSAPLVRAAAPPMPENPATPAVEKPRTEANQVVAPAAPAISSASSALPTFVGPQVIHEVTPAVPRGVGPMITTDVQVDVAVTIDANGKVTGARVASSKGAAAGLLTIEVLKAARLFRFLPARENGGNVASSMVLTFRFGRTGK